MDPALSGALIGLFVGAAVVTVGLIIAAMRKASSAVKTKPRKILAFMAPMPPANVMRTVIQFAQQSGYKVEDISEHTFRIILGEAPTFTTWGFFYPIYMTPQQNGGTLIEVGIKSKVFQMGPIVNRKHETCFNGVRAAIMASA